MDNPSCGVEKLTPEESHTALAEFKVWLVQEQTLLYPMLDYFLRNRLYEPYLKLSQHLFELGYATRGLVHIINHVTDGRYENELQAQYSSCEKEEEIALGVVKEFLSVVI